VAVPGRSVDAVDDPDRPWGEMLAAWAIPPRLMEAVPQSPYFFDPQVFISAADEALARPDDTPSDRVARQALDGGTVLDVASGAGAASLRLGASQVTAVDSNGPLLAAFAARATAAGIRFDAVEGPWPEVAPRVAPADVVVCHHVFYNVADLAPFAAELTAHARRRVVVELTAEHPMRWLAPYWRAVHGLPRPDRPTADDAVAVLQDIGLDVHAERWRRRVQMIGELGPDRVDRMARRLCLPDARRPELRRLLDEQPPPSERDVVTLWW